jgi:isopentenyl diphosphate isomerase/L-lactate dehydrogenase-like FMN-dependent dehydrogenase
MAGLSWPKGEVVAAHAANEAGTIYTLSTHSSCSLEEVATGAPAPLWFQLYVWQNRDLTRSFVERARAAGYRALLLTVDVPDHVLALVGVPRVADLDRTVVRRADDL